MLSMVVPAFWLTKGESLSPEAKAHIAKIEGLIKDGDMYWDKGEKDRAVEAYIVRRAAPRIEPAGAALSFWWISELESFALR